MPSGRQQRAGPEAAQGPVYSVTSLMVYEACPLQYYDAFVRGIPPPRSPAMERGVTIHKLIADHLVQPSLLPPELDPDLRRLFDTFLRSRFNVAPVLREDPFTLAFERGEVRGRVDLVIPASDGGLEIVDFKSGVGRSREEMDRSLQLPIYSLAVSRRFDRPAEDIRYSYFFLGDGVEVSFRPDGEAFRRLEARVDRTLAAIQEGRFQPAQRCRCYACARNRRRRWSRSWPAAGREGPEPTS